ncbi:MAG: GAF domain-containing sensor histidine kinase [Mycobacteriales bacterium]
MEQTTHGAVGGGPVVQGAIGELFYVTTDVALVLEGGAVVASNGPASAFFRCERDELAAVVDLDALVEQTSDGALHRVFLPPYGVLELQQRCIGDRCALIGRDITAGVRQADGLRRIAAVSRELLGEPPTVAQVLQSLATEAKVITGAAYSALLLLREGSDVEVSHFAYDAPRQLFPTRMPRLVGLLAVPVSTRAPARIDDIRGHPSGLGLPGVHPPVGPLLAVPVLAGDVVLGELAVGNPPHGRAFDDVDEELLLDLAAHVAVAVRWAQQAEQVRERELHRQEVVDTARHDIRTPLGAGKGYAALLARKLDVMSPEQVATALRGLTDAFDRIESFTQRLLADRRDEVVGVEPVWQQIDVAQVLDTVRRDAEATTGRPAVLVELDPVAPTTLAGDPEMVREVVDNLVGNALKHSPVDRPVVVSVRAEGPHVRLDVRDEGPGIPETEQAGLFERWSRTDSSRARQVPGLGLGLSIVKRLVAAHSGTLGVSSRPGEGATFWVTFPTEVPA